MAHPRNLRTITYYFHPSVRENWQKILRFQVLGQNERCHSSLFRVRFCESRLEFTVTIIISLSSISCSRTTIHQVISIYINFCTIAARSAYCGLSESSWQSWETKQKLWTWFIWIESRLGMLCFCFSQTGKDDSPEGKRVLIMPVQTD